MKCKRVVVSRRCLKPYRLACYVFSVGMEGLCCLFTPLLRSFPLLVPFAVLYGYFDGAYVALIPVVTSDLVGAPYLSSALGVVYFLHAIPYLISPPIGGKKQKQPLNHRINDRRLKTLVCSRWFSVSS